MVSLFRNMDEKIRVGFLTRLVKIAVRFYRLKDT